jgi:hypothetical protein
VLVLISALALLAADPAPGTTVTPVDVNAPQRASIPVGEIGVKDPDRLTCKREAVVGSRRKTKICDTKAGWQKREDQAQQIMDGNRTTGDSKPR